MDACTSKQVSTSGSAYAKSCYSEQQSTWLKDGKELASNEPRDAVLAPDACISQSWVFWRLEDECTDPRCLQIAREAL